MDKIYIKDLEIFGYHGVCEEEKRLGQKFLISLELSLSLKEAGLTDDLTKTVNYAELCKKIENKFTAEAFDLIEKCAEELAGFVLQEYGMVQKVKVLIKKPWAPILMHLDYAAVEVERSWHKVYIGMGSNMGEREQNIKTALEKIDNTHVKVCRVSGFYSTKPVGYEDQEDFINAAAELKTLLSPRELMVHLLKVENELKRERKVRWGPRTIDLDVLFYDNEITSEEEIIIPHPRMQERLFVLVPMCDLAPYLMHPVLNKRLCDLKEELLKTQSL